MITWLKQAWADLISWLKAIFSALMDFLIDLPVKLLEAFLDAILFLLNSIPVPDFIAGGIDSFMSAVGNDVLYFVSMSGFDDAMALLGAGLTFRLLRKLFTLGQW